MSQSNDAPRQQDPRPAEDLLARIRRKCSNDRLWSAGAREREPEQLTLDEREEDA
jgi:hypothetical protein